MLATVIAQPEQLVVKEVPTPAPAAAFALVSRGEAVRAVVGPG